MITDTIFKKLKPFPTAQRLARRVFRRLWNRKRIVTHYQQLLQVNPVEHSGYYLYYEGVYDKEVFKFLDKETCRYNFAVDAGANIGVYTCFLAARISNVTAFEPMPQVAEVLRQNIKLNKFQNVTLHEACVSDSKGDISFTTPSAANSGIGRISAEQVGSKLTVPCVTLDDFLLAHVSDSVLIKMDIEGAEWMALHGMKQFLKLRTGLLSMLIEVHPEEIEGYGGTVMQFYDFLESFGLLLYQITDEGLELLDRSSPPRFCWATSKNPFDS